MSKITYKKPSPKPAPSSDNCVFSFANVLAIKANPHNARVHNNKQRHALKKSIEKYGFNSPLIVDHSMKLIAGHARLDAAKELDIKRVPIVKLHNLSPEDVRAYMIADNRIAELATWEKEQLAIELQHLVEVGYNLDITGFEAPEIDFLIEDQLSGPASVAGDEIPEIQLDAAPVSKEGDLWKLGLHKILCGNALKQQDYKRLLGAKKAQLVFTDPPYNCKIDGHVSGLGTVKHKDFQMASGEMSAIEFIRFLEKALNRISVASRDGAVIYVCMDWRNIDRLIMAGRGVLSQLLNICVWNKTNAGMGSLYRSQHEMVAVFKNGSKPHINNVELGKHKRNRSNVWTYAGVNTFRNDRMDELAMHPTVKPVALVADAMRDCSKRGGTVLDPFAGSGTTIIAAEETGRVAYGIELDPAYVDVAIRRWEKFTGEKAIHEDTGLTYEELALSRTTSASLVGGV